MRRTAKIFRAASLCAIVGAAASTRGACAQGANLIQDGGFETPATPAGGYSLYNVGQSVGAWIVVGASGSNLNTVSTSYQDRGILFDAEEGQAYMDLTGTSNAATGVSQTVTTTVGTRYQLTFYVGNVDDPSGVYGTTSRLKVFIGATHVLTARNDIKVSGKQVWKAFSVTFKATGSKTRIRFVNADPANDSDCGLDNVALVALGS